METWAFELEVQKNTCLDLIIQTKDPVGLTRIASFTLLIPGFWLGSTGDAFHLHPVPHLFLKSDDSNFVQNYFGVGRIFCSKKNYYQIDNDVSMTSSMLWWLSKTAKNSLF